MPELPEVETVRRRLAELITGQSIIRLQILHQKSFLGEATELIGKQIKAVERRAKILHLKLSDHKSILIHLKMTGQLIYQQGESRVGGGHPSADWTKSLPSSHTRLIFFLQAHNLPPAKLFFNDQRIFGWIKLMETEDAENQLDLLAPDVIDDEITVELVQQKLLRRTVPIKQAIMDAKVFSGVGNIYACEALFDSKILPTRPAKSLTIQETKLLLTNCKKIINQAIELGGTTFDGHYVTVDGLAGGYQAKLKIYGRKSNCLNCGSPISRFKLGGRGTYACLTCQK